MKNQKTKKAFTLVEVLMVVCIIGILAIMLLVSINQARKRARLNEVKTTLRSALSALVACRYAGGNVRAPKEEDPICFQGVGLAGAKWPKLSHDYEYISGDDYDRDDCSFEIATNGDSANLKCECVRQSCLEN